MFFVDKSGEIKAFFMKKVGIIGAGIAGIASAIRLANKGYSVEVFEANEYAGGKLSNFEQKGFRFDAGPSLFTLPHLVEELFTLSGKNPTDFFDYERLDVICHYFWEDGTRLKALAQPQDFAQEIERVIGVPAHKVTRFLADSAFKYDVLDGLFLQDSLHKLSTWTSAKALRGYLNLPKLGIFGTMNDANQKQFQHPKLVQLFNRYATYNGSDPYQTPATLNIIPHLEYNIGAFFPRKGMVDITNSLVQLAESLGVVFHYQTPVLEIITSNHQVSGIRTAHSTLDFDIVVSNMDITPTYRKLLPKAQHPDRLLDQPKSSSGVIFYWGINQQFPELDLHNIFFSDNYQEEFKWMFDKNDIYHDPTVYINITSKNKPNDAPSGCENWFVLVNAPANNGQDWDNIIDKLRENILQKISRILSCDIKKHLVCEAILDPRSIESKTSSAQGALYGNSSNNKYAAFLRHANFSSKIKNLYFVGGSVHPGGGIPLALSSAKIMAKEL